ncbi:hypothetical protein NEOLEDRAFT_258815 [Neolentinus lepideus HHB14362 ss-1]|uniref:Secreted protein n=1 Tax=Neolentinus lepideus HHB14362 ss-1 TaxID=1314782 RepID=A0A165M910_9AGAM|nr:hypothetical protein NEOLEDRAFT_258815 [Neolentinus lepideus HHB14362 ss-1]
MVRWCICLSWVPVCLAINTCGSVLGTASGSVLTAGSRYADSDLSTPVNEKSVRDSFALFWDRTVLSESRHRIAS